MAVIHPNIGPSWCSPNDGTGPNRLGRIVAIYRTVIERIKGIFGKMLEETASAGMMITNTRLGRAIQDSTANQGHFFCAFNFIQNGSISSTTTLNDLSQLLEGVKNRQERQIAIPLLINKGGLLDSNHFVTVFIDRDLNQVEYYDSKGQVSEYFLLAGDANLRHFIDLCVTEVFTEDQQVTVFENRVTQQYDCYHCAAYVFAYILNRANGVSSTEYCARTVDWASMDEVRRNHFNIPNGENDAVLMQN